MYPSTVQNTSSLLIYLAQEHGHHNPGNRILRNRHTLLTAFSLASAALLGTECCGAFMSQKNLGLRFILSRLMPLRMKQPLGRGIVILDTSESETYKKEIIQLVKQHGLRLLISKVIFDQATIKEAFNTSRAAVVFKKNKTGDISYLMRPKSKCRDLGSLACACKTAYELVQRTQLLTLRQPFRYNHDTAPYPFNQLLTPSILPQLKSFLSAEELPEPKTLYTYTLHNIYTKEEKFNECLSFYMEAICHTQPLGDNKAEQQALKDHEHQWLEKIKNDEGKNFKLSKAQRGLLNAALKKTEHTTADPAAAKSAPKKRCVIS